MSIPLSSASDDTTAPPQSFTLFAPPPCPAVLIDLFHTPRPVIGVVHLLPLPGSARWQGSLTAVVERAAQEATALASGGANALIVENFFDAPFTAGQVDPAVVSAVSLVIERLQHLVTLPIGVNLLRNDAVSALAVAACTGAAFIRVNVLIGAMATDQGIIQGQAHRLMRYRRELGCDVKILADVLVKHAVPLGPVPIAAAVQETLHRGLADAIIVSGPMTGTPPSKEDLALAKAAADAAPVLIGSGATTTNVAELMTVADGVIVSSALKRRGQIEQPIDPHRVGQFVEAVRHSLLV